MLRVVDQNRVKGTQSLIVAIAIIFSFGLGISFIPYYGHLKEVEISNWPTINVNILTSTLESHYGKSNTKYFVPKITYEYKINDRIIRSSRVFYTSISTDFGHADEIIQKYPPNSVRSAHYMPSDPAVSFLISQQDDGKWKGDVLEIAFISFVLIVISIAVSIKMSRENSASGKQ